MLHQLNHYDAMFSCIYRSALDVKEACDVRRQFVHERNLYDPLSRLQSDIYRMAFNRAPRKLPEGYIGMSKRLFVIQI